MPVRIGFGRKPPDQQMGTRDLGFDWPEQLTGCSSDYVEFGFWSLTALHVRKADT
jgi:hypothetical protein